MWRMIFLLVALAGLSVIVFAQDEPITWPPNPDDIFSENVTILSVEETSRIIPRALEDNETRTITIEENGIITRTVPYPPSLDSIAYVQLQADGTFLIATDYDRETQLYHYIIYNLATGEITPAPTVCGGYLPDTSSSPQWVFVDNDLGKYLCNTATGEHYGPLPENIDWTANEFNNRLAYVTMSPDGNWVVLTAIRPETYYHSFEYYGLELATSNLNYLGKIYYNMFSVANYLPTFGEWVSDTQGPIHYYTDSESMPNSFYVFDVTKSDSLQLGTQGWVYDFYDDPPRYEYTVTDQFIRHKTGSVPQEHINCTLMVYDANGLRNFDLGYDCGRYSTDPFDCTTSLHRVGDDYVYLQFNEDPTAMSSVMWLDTETGEMHSLLQGEIEALVDVSADGQYVAFIGGHTGQVDAVDSWCNLSDEMLSLHVLRLSDSEELERAYVQFDSRISEIQAVSPSTEQFVMGNRLSWMYDIHHRQFISLVDGESRIFEQYSFDYVWDETGLQVIVSNREDYSQRIIYRVALDTLP